jgi:hypothetical protein
MALDGEDGIILFKDYLLVSLLWLIPHKYEIVYDG